MGSPDGQIGKLIEEVKEAFQHPEVGSVTVCVTVNKRGEGAVREVYERSREAQGAAESQDAATEQDVQTVQNERDDAKEQLARVEEELRQARKNLEDTKKEAENDRDAAKKELEQAENERDDVINKLAQAEDDRDAAEEQLARAKRDLNDAKEQLAQAKKNLEDAKKQAQKDLDAAKDKAQRDLNAAQDKLTQAERDRDAAQDRLNPFTRLISVFDAYHSLPAERGVDAKKVVSAVDPVAFAAAGGDWKHILRYWDAVQGECEKADDETRRVLTDVLEFLLDCQNAILLSPVYELMPVDSEIGRPYNRDRHQQSAGCSHGQGNVEKVLFPGIWNRDTGKAERKSVVYYP